MFAPPCELLAPFGFSLVILACAAGGGWTDRLLGNRAVAFLGEISFSLYLVHFVLLGLFMFVAQRLMLAEASLLVRAGYAAGAVLVVYAVSTLTWRFVELPGQRAGRYVKMKWLSARGDGPDAAGPSIGTGATESSGRDGVASSLP